jgi:hypothetical protein
VGGGRETPGDGTGTGDPGRCAIRRVGPFGHDDLLDLDSLYARADRVIPMRDVWKGDTNQRAIAVRHDVDDNPGAFDTALRMAEWEFERGYSSTYYLLHSAGYWDADNLVRALTFQELGHEVGVHVNAIAESLRRRRAPDWILLEALSDLRSVGLRIDGMAAHGDPLCRDKQGRVRFVNDEMFLESRRPSMGSATRTVTHKKTTVMLEPQPRANYHLSYDASWLPRGDYLSDSGHVWSQEFDHVCRHWPKHGQLHMLVHPDWWVGAFPMAVAA